jgi:hypothetical protein
MRLMQTLSQDSLSEYGHSQIAYAERVKTISHSLLYRLFLHSGASEKRVQTMEQALKKGKKKREALEKGGNNRLLSIQFT